MSFIYADAKTHEILDILPDRRLHQLREHFLGFPKKARDGVKTLTMDMYSPYISLVKEIFPNARIILDRFHVVQLLMRALLKTRIATMNTLDRDSLEQKILRSTGETFRKTTISLIVEQGSTVITGEPTLQAMKP